MSANRPNVVLIHTDQQRYDSLGCTGHPGSLTPNIDRLAAEGCSFSRHFVSNTVCMPSRASLFTGRYAPGHGVWSNGVALRRNEYAQIAEHGANDGIYPPEPATLADVFASAGYDTASFGKLHLSPSLAPAEYGYHESCAVWETGRLDDWHGPYYGFRHIDMTKSHGDNLCDYGHYANWLRDNHPDLRNAVIADRRADGKPIPSVRDCYVSKIPWELHHSRWVAERFADYIGENREAGKPFFAFAGIPDPHHPFTPCAEFAEMFADAELPERFDPEGSGFPSFADETPFASLSENEWNLIRRHTLAQIHQIDLAVGIMLDALRDAGELDNTIIAFTCDHGDYMGDHGRLRKGMNASRALLHVPLILRVPGMSLPQTSDLPVSNCDVLPTLAAMAGIEPTQPTDGENVLPLLNDASCDRHVYAHVYARGAKENINYTVFDRRYRLTWYPHRDYTELFDHETDFGECRNVADDPGMRNTVDRLRQCILRGLAHCDNPQHDRVSPW